MGSGVFLSVGVSSPESRLRVHGHDLGEAVRVVRVVQPRCARARVVRCRSAYQQGAWSIPRDTAPCAVFSSVSVLTARGNRLYPLIICPRVRTAAVLDVDGLQHAQAAPPERRTRSAEETRGVGGKLQVAFTLYRSTRFPALRKRPQG